MNIYLQIIGAFLLRLLKIFPNNDPLVAFILPQSKTNIIHSSIFILCSVFLFDLLTSGIGIWTYLVAATYLVLGLAAGLFLRNKNKLNLLDYAGTSIIFILLFDFITGPIISTFIFGAPFLITLFGQIPFTFMHLISGVTYTILLVPFLDPQLDSHKFLKNNLFKHIHLKRFRL